jgi:hypothetical protein
MRRGGTKFLFVMPDDFQKRARVIVRQLLKPGKVEGPRLELKRELVLTPVAKRAEFIRDLLSLANSEGEYPRENAYLVLGVKDGMLTDTSALNLDGAQLGQIMDAHIVPPLKYLHCSFYLKKGVRTDVIEIEPDGNVLYIVKGDLKDEKNQILLRAGQSWGRRADRKIHLSGPDIIARLQQIQSRLCELATSPLKQRLTELEQRLGSTGPENDVRRILYEMEQCQQDKDWDGLKSRCWALSPYIRDFGEIVSKPILDSFGSFTDVRDGTPGETVDAIINIIFSCLPMHSLRHRSHRDFSSEDVEFFDRAAELAWEIAYDAIKYTGDLEVAKNACQSLADIGKVAHLNNIAGLATAVADHFDRLKEVRERCSRDEKFNVLINYFESEAKLEEPERPDFLE